MSTKEIIDTLVSNRLMQDEGEVKAYQDALEQMDSNIGSDEVAASHGGFDDTTHQLDVMWGLVHFLESLPVEQQLRGMIDALPNVMEHAEEWMEILMFRILNDESSRLMLRQLLSEKDDVAEMKALVTRIRAEEPSLAEHADFVLG